MKKNIITIIFLVLMLITAGFSIKLYSDLVASKSTLAKREADIREVNVSLEQRNIELAEKNVQLEDMKKLNRIAFEQIKQFSPNNKTVQDIVIKELTREQRALNLEKEGFESIINNNFDTAFVKFKLTEATFPGFHAAYEISNLLGKQKQNLKDPAFQKFAKQEIIKKYWGYLSQKQLSILKDQVKE